MAEAATVSVVRLFCATCREDSDFVSLPRAEGFELDERMCVWCGAAALVDAPAVDAWTWMPRGASRSLLTVAAGHAPVRGAAAAGGHVA